MNALRFHRFILLALGVASLCLIQTGRAVEGDPRSQAEALAQSCSPEFDDPATPEYKQCTQAIQMFERLAVQKPDDASIFLALGSALANRDREKSIDAYRRVLAIEPNNVSANFALGLLLESPAQRIQHLRAVLAAEPNHPQAHVRLARLLAAGAEADEAVAEIKRQIEINPYPVDLIDNVMQDLVAKGKKSEAGEVLIAYVHARLPSQEKCNIARFLVREYADQADVVKAVKEQCPVRGGEGADFRTWVVLWIACHSSALARHNDARAAARGAVAHVDLREAGIGQPASMLALRVRLSLVVNAEEREVRRSFRTSTPSARASAASLIGPSLSGVKTSSCMPASIAIDG